MHGIPTGYRDQTRATLEADLRRLALYVDRVADGDPVFILAAGYDYKQTGISAGGFSYTFCRSPYPL